MNVSKKAMGIAWIASAIFFFLSLWLSEATFMDKHTGATIFFEYAFYVSIPVTIILFIVWFNADGRK